VVPYDESTAVRAPRPALQDLSNLIIMQCVTQLELIQTLEWILLSSTQPEHPDAKPSRPIPAKDADQTCVGHKKLQAMHACALLFHFFQSQP
jgi:hypothetical protein